MTLFAKRLASTVLGLSLLSLVPACGHTDSGPGGPPPPTCGSCASYESCLPSGLCGITPNSTWFFAADHATVATTKSDGSAWDPFGGAPDPYVQLDSTRTSIKQDTFSPIWQEGTTYTATNLLSQGVSVTVYDSDPNSSDDLIGGPTTVRPTEADLRRGTLTVNNLGQVISISFTMMPQ